MNVSSANNAAMSRLHVNGATKAATADSDAPAKAAASGSTASKASPAATTVTISSAARAALAEASETPAQTAQEAQGNDLQAKRLLAKEQAAKAGG